MKDEAVRRRLAAILALIVAASGLAVAAAGPASASPRPLSAPGGTGDDGEGGAKSLTDQLAAASRGFIAARDALAHSKQRQQQLTATLKTIDAELGPRQATLDEIAQQTYRTGRLGPMDALLTASSSGTLLDRAETLESIAVQQNDALLALKDARTRQGQAKIAIDAEIRGQQKQLNAMAKRKAQAENALKAANAGQDASSPSDSANSANSAIAIPAPRNSSGGFSPESCSLNDPTTTGCITPRTLHAMQQAQRAGFNHFVACFRQQSSGEHPLGRACDFAADKDGFGGVASGTSRTYGDRLAYFFVNNSSRLGVLYVIWFRRIWLPSSGWKAYTRGNGDPSSDHTNHVHLSEV